MAGMGPVVIIGAQRFRASVPEGSATHNLSRRFIFASSPPSGET
jgi:hypothetical protein